jgi:predicted restriction endonuclease
MNKKKYLEDDTYCENCNTTLVRHNRESFSSFKDRRFCSRKCATTFNSLGDVSKEEIKKRTTGYQSYRTAIRKNSYKVMELSGLEKKCAICGYSTHVEICHIKSVSSFDESARLSDINSIDNLVYLCPNHHYEFDNGIIKL